MDSGAVSPSAGDPRDALRVGNAERERVVTRLNQAFADGQLELAELEERISVAYAAKTAGELRVLTADLSTPPGSGAVEFVDRQPATPQDLRQALLDLATHKINAKVERDRERPLRRARRSEMVHRAGQRAMVATWATASVITFTIWLIIGVTSGFTSPWFLWVAGPWGAVLLMRALTGRST
ncbi:MAG: DUF1707 domain-containing protein [Actinobacteria bacterium]|nr:DUF1707 domain-containing protein [Actinomycetota bacterium]